MSERKVIVEGIGKLWMPMVPVAFRREWKVGSGPWEHDLHTLEDVEQLLFTSSSEGTGDFSQVVDYRVRYEVKRVYYREGVVGHIVHHRVKVAREWEKEGSEMWWDLSFGEEE